jgi:Tol biopolymer transport system component
MARFRLFPALLALIVPGVALAQTGDFPVPPGQIVVGDENGLYVIQADGTEKTYLAEESEPDCWLRDGMWSPDGLQIMYTSICGGGSPTDWRPDADRQDLRQRSATVMVYDVALRESRELVPSDGIHQDYAGDWHPNGSQIVIYSDRDSSETFNLYLFDLDSSELTQLTSFESNASRVSFDPAGRYLLYNRQIADENGLRFEVRVFDTTDEAEIRVTTGLTPNWSPEGQWITYATEGESADVFLMPAACVYSGGGCDAAEDARNITLTPDIAEREPIFSPDQRQLAYLRNTSVESGLIVWDLYRQDIRTGLLQNLTETDAISERHRSWEPVPSTPLAAVESVLPVVARVTTSEGSANLREEPATSSNIVGQALAGQLVFVQGASPDGDWYRITLPEDGAQAWLFANLATVVEGDLATLPEIAP